MNWKLLAKAFGFVVLGLVGGVGGMFFFGWAMRATNGWLGVVLIVAVLTTCMYQALKS